MRGARLLPPLLALLVAAPAPAREDAGGTGRWDPTREAVALRVHLLSRPHDTEAWCRLGDAERERCALDAAREAYRRALDADLDDPAARAGLGEILLLQGRPAEALAQATLGMAGARGRSSGALWRVRALALLELGDGPGAGAAAARAVALAPGDARAHEALARTRFRAGDMPGATEAYALAARLDPWAEEAHLRLGSGFGPPDGDRPPTDPVLEAAWARGLAHLDAGRWDAAADAFAFLCGEAPEVAPYHLGLGLALAALRRAADPAVHGVEDALLGLPAPAVEDLDRVVTGLGDAGPLERQVVLLATAPAAAWWPALVASGARHEILGLEDRLTAAPARQDLRGRRTGDGRLYDHLRGVGGADAATGTEKLREAADLAFNVFAHELAHQLHRHALPAALVEEVDALYAAARREGRCLDWYAASSVDEYFAQGYEAMVSLAKRGCLKETQGHTREELARRDPALHDFFLRHLALDHEDAAAGARLRAAAGGDEPAGLVREMHRAAQGAPGPR